MSLKLKNRIYQIDLFRFLAALAVVLYHYLFNGYSSGMSYLNFNEIRSFFKYGYLGVDIFFIISGFVIALSIKHRSLVHFWISRISRLYPVYWISVLLTFTVMKLFGAPRYIVWFKQLLVNLTMFQNYIGVGSIDGVYWSLFVEMKFYIFVISSYLIVNKLKKIKLDYLVYSWLSLSIAYVYLNELFIFQVANNLFILEWSSYFIAGIVFYQIYESKLNLKYFIVLSISFLISTHHAILKSEELELYHNTTFSPFIIVGYLLLFYLLMLLVSSKKLNSINSTKLTKLGMLTYPLYLIHQNIGFIIFNNLVNYMNKYVLLISTIILMIFLSYILSNFYESRISNYLKSQLIKLNTKYIGNNE
ncbi:acyltransferase family protein [Zobellia nedashkovskayae]